VEQKIIYTPRHDPPGTRNDKMSILRNPLIQAAKDEDIAELEVHAVPMRSVQEIA
jgi:hypothetical protein